MKNEYRIQACSYNCLINDFLKLFFIAGNSQYHAACKEFKNLDVLSFINKQHSNATNISETNKYKRSRQLNEI